MILAVGKTFIFCSLKVILSFIISFLQQFRKNTWKNVFSVIFYEVENAMKLTPDLIL